jgi:hypothetical protein
MVGGFRQEDHLAQVIEPHRRGVLRVSGDDAEQLGLFERPVAEVEQVAGGDDLLDLAVRVRHEVSVTRLMQIPGLSHVGAEEDLSPAIDREVVQATEHQRPIRARDGVPFLNDQLRRVRRAGPEPGAGSPVRITRVGVAPPPPLPPPPPAT